MCIDAMAGDARFAALRLAGPDAADFLQGYLTADLDGLTPSAALPMAYCNLKGRVLASGWVAGTPTDVLLLVGADVADVFAKDLGKYLLFAKAKLQPVTTGLAFAAEPAADAVALPPTTHHLRLAPAHRGHEALANACVATAFVVATAAISQRFLPQMIGLTAAGAVSFAKGCYLGQEVVARAEHRGEVKQKLHRFKAAADAPPAGTDVLVGGAKAGIVVATAPGVVLASVRGDPATATAGGCELRADQSVRMG